MVGIVDDESNRATSTRKVSRFFSRKPVTLYVTGPAKCLIVKRSEFKRGRA